MKNFVPTVKGKLCENVLDWMLNWIYFPTVNHAQWCHNDVNNDDEMRIKDLHGKWLHCNYTTHSLIKFPAVCDIKRVDIVRHR